MCPGLYSLPWYSCRIQGTHRFAKLFIGRNHLVTSANRYLSCLSCPSGVYWSVNLSNRKKILRDFSLFSKQSCISNSGLDLLKFSCTCWTQTNSTSVFAWQCYLWTRTEEQYSRDHFHSQFHH